MCCNFIKKKIFKIVWKIIKENEFVGICLLIYSLLNGNFIKLLINNFIIED